MAPGEPDRQVAAAQAFQDRALEELAGILAEQKALAQRGDLRSVQELVVESDKLLRKLAEAGPLTPQSATRLSEVIKAHRQVELILVAARQEAAGRLASLGRGTSALRGYRSF